MEGRRVDVVRRTSLSVDTPPPAIHRCIFHEGGRQLLLGVELKENSAYFQGCMGMLKILEGLP